MYRCTPMQCFISSAEMQAETMEIPSGKERNFPFFLSVDLSCLLETESDSKPNQEMPLRTLEGWDGALKNPCKTAYCPKFILKPSIGIMSRQTMRKKTSLNFLVGRMQQMSVCLKKKSTRDNRKPVLSSFSDRPCQFSIKRG